LKEGIAPDSPVTQRYALAAQNHAVEATSICLRAGDAKGVFLGRHLQVGSAMAAGDLPRARRENSDLLGSLGAASSGEAELHRAITLKLLGQIELQQEDVAAAEERTLQALALFEKQGDLRQASDCFNTLASIAERKADYRAALDWQRRCFDGFMRFASTSAKAHAAAMEVREETARTRALAAAQRARADRLQRSNEELEREARRLARSALEDSLTGVANRRRLDQELGAFLADRRARQRCSLALLDIDHFKEVNDRFLHTTGDKVLTRLGAILRQCSREGDLVARFGGEEFAIVFVNVDTADVAQACERIRAAITDAAWSEFHPELSVTASIGFCHFSEVEDSMDDLIKVADARLFQAKRGGRNCVVGPTEPTRGA
jgi:diguanylate cyclase (GGDEF)-like protein